MVPFCLCYLYLGWSHPKCSGISPGHVRWMQTALEELHWVPCLLQVQPWSWIDLDFSRNEISHQHRSLLLVLSYTLYILLVRSCECHVIDLLSVLFGLASCPASACLPVRNGLVNKVELLGLITQNWYCMIVQSVIIKKKLLTFIRVSILFLSRLSAECFEHCCRQSVH